MTTSEMSSGNSNNNNNNIINIINNANTNNTNNNTASSSSAVVDGGVFHLRIKSFKDVEIAVPSGSVVAHVKQQVRAALLGPPGGGGSGSGSGVGGGGDDNDRRYLRLICKGRLLLPDDHPISDFNVQNGDVVHAVLAPLPPTSSTTTHGAAASTRRPPRRRRRRTRPNNIRRNGTIVGPGGRVTRAPPTLGNYGDDDDDDDDTSTDDESDDYEFDEEEDGEEEEGGDGGDVEAGRTTSTTTTTRRISRRRRRGFDRLRELDNGYLLPQTRLPRSEVQAIRAYFSRQVDRYQAQHPDAHMEEGDVLLRRRLFEEDWMAQQVPTSEFRLNLNQNMTLMRLAALQNGRGGGMMTMSGTTGTGAAGGGSGYNPANAYYGSLTAGTDRDFMWGFMLGFFVGFVMLVWVWMPTVPHKQKIGILTGISFQLALNVLVEPPPTSDLDLDEQVDGSAGGGASGDYEMED